MQKYIKKPIPVIAVQWKGDNTQEVAEFCPQVVVKDGLLYISTLEGMMKTSVGDYLIQGAAGEFYPCRKDIFEATYLPVGTESTDS